MNAKTTLSERELSEILRRAGMTSGDDESLWHNAVRLLWQKLGDDPYSGTPYITWFETLQAVLKGRFLMDSVPNADMYNTALKNARHTPVKEPSD
jgi:hypothetical protein